MRRTVSAALRALQDELAGGPRAALTPDLELLADLVRARDDRQRSQEPERELVAALSDAAALVGRDERVRVANAAFERLAPSGRAVGRTVLEVTRLEELAAAVRRALEGTARSFEVVAPARRLVWVVEVSPLLRGEALLVLRDVTRERRAEGVRRDFVANASHELRTPIAAIRGAAETLLGGAGEERESRERFAAMILRQADRLERLTKDLLDLSRLESGQWQMELAPIELREAARAVLDLHAERAAERGKRLVVEVPAGVAARADLRALEQVLVNLVDNAVKHTPEGGTVTVRGGLDDLGPIVAVEDDGPGIDRHHLPRLFERFYRVDAGRSREAGGTGLGLAIVKHLVHAQGGEVGVESGPAGSRFWFRLQAP